MNNYRTCHYCRAIGRPCEEHPPASLLTSAAAGSSELPASFEPLREHSDESVVDAVYEFMSATGATTLTYMYTAVSAVCWLLVR